MADDELNIPTHRYYQQRFNVQLANEDISRKYIYASGIRKIEARIGEVVIREPLFLNNGTGLWLDPSDVANLDWRRNLLTYSEDFSNAYWTAGAVNLTSLAAGRITPTTTSAQHRYDRTTTIAAAAHTFSMEVKADGYNFIWIRLGAISAVFNTTTGDAAGVTSGATASFTNANDGYIRITLSGTAAGNDTLRINVLPSTSTADFAGDGTSGILIRKAQLELGSVATDYQPISNVNTEVLERFPKTTMFQDRAGTTAVTTPGQSVGLVLDKSKGLVLGPQLVTNGTFDTDLSGWAQTGNDASNYWEWASNAARCVSAGTFVPLSQAIITTGQQYVLTLDVTVTSGGLKIGSTSAGIYNDIAANISSSGTYTYTFTALSNTLYFGRFSGVTNVSLDNISVKELPGNHVAQPTAAARPRYIVDADGTFIQHDLVDDALTVTLPDMGTEATVAYVTRSEVRLLEDQTISGSYTLPKQEIAGFIAIDRALTQAEKINVIRYLASKVEGVNYGAEIDRLTLIAINAVDVFVYDTSKDSDGGAWRAGALAQASSWYNETLNTATRGARREFPAVAVIVAESNKVTIYDGDDPALPMWMVFTGGIVAYLPTVVSLTVTNGKLCVGGTNGLMDWDFLLDRMRFYQAGSSRSQSNISTRGSASLAANGLTAYLVNTTVNDVAMTVLPDAPIDPATGLPVPTIAVATAGGVSVIKDDGTVVDINTVDAKRVTFYDENKRLILRESGNACSYGLLPTVDQSSTSWREGFFNETTSFPSTLNQTNQKLYSNRKLELGVPSDKGVSLIDVNGADQATSTGAYITSTYNTGWMNGNIKGAFLSDTDDTDLVASDKTPSDFATSGWVFQSGLSEVSGSLVLSSGGTGGAGAYFPVSENGVYITIDISDLTGTDIQIAACNDASGSNQGPVQTIPTGTTGLRSVFINTTSTTGFRLRFQQSATNTATVDTISVVLSDADRSVNANPLIVNGTVTRTPVATGADLVAYSGFSGSNYLEQPYNSGLDFGTGDFSVMGWVAPPAAGTQRTLLSKGPVGTNTSPYFEYRLDGDNTIKWVGNNSTSRLGTTVLTAGLYYQVVFVRASGVGYLYLNGVLQVSSANTDNYNHSSADILRVGSRHDGGASAFTGSLALIRISATAPTAEQIAKIYNDEKVLFEPNAQATLYGASDAVTALAHDPDTDLLHVGTSAGRSVFEGLRRVGNTTTSVSTSISASGGLIVEK